VKYAWVATDLDDWRRPKHMPVTITATLIDERRGKVINAEVITFTPRTGAWAKSERIDLKGKEVTDQFVNGLGFVYRPEPDGMLDAVLRKDAAACRERIHDVAVDYEMEETRKLHAEYKEAQRRLLRSSASAVWETYVDARDETEKALRDFYATNNVARWYSGGVDYFVNYGLD
jgi:hypothetical protein